MAKSFSKHFEQLPPSIQNLLRQSVSILSPVEIILFGSRSRGDHRDNSDFDIAFKLTPEGKSHWSKFVVTAAEEPWTLFDLDLVDMDELGQDYLQNIKTEGKRLYA